MGRITSNIGLITGVPITDTVNQLVALKARPRDLVAAQSQKLEAQQFAITSLTALLIGFQFAARQLGTARLFEQREATASDPALGVTVTGTPPLGNYQYTPVQTAQSQQLVSTGFASDSAPIGSGTFSFRFGGFIDSGINLDLLNGGEGFERGKIRVTDRSGANAEIDLRFARTVDDVLRAINDNTAIDVTAEVSGDRLRLIDNTGQTTANLRVQEVGGTAAASLGLAAVNVADSQADGNDILRLFSGLRLDQLNDRTGVGFNEALPDLEITFRDNSTPLTIDFHRLATPASGSNPAIPATNEQTLGDVLATLNAADPARLRAEISADGERLVLTDLTADSGGTFHIASTLGSTAAEDLGLTGAANGGVISSSRLLTGLKTVSLGRLNGGAGLAPLGQLSLTDRSGAAATVDLSTTTSVEDLIDLINSAGIGIRAEINAARNGILVRDTTGSTAGNLQIASGDSTNTAETLGIVTDAAITSADSGSLKLQAVSRSTQLAALNGGAGVAKGSFRITDSGGTNRTVNLVGDDILTVGDVIDEVNLSGIGVKAQINDAGDGIVLIDTANGEGTLSVAAGVTSTAADLHLLGPSVERQIGGQPTHLIDGATTYTVELDDTTTLDDLVTKLNALGAGVTAAKFTDGSALNPFRFTLTSQRSGEAANLLVDTSQTAFRLEETSHGRDALLVSGALDGARVGLLASSPDGQFNDLLAGVSIQVREQSSAPVTINVQGTDTSLVSAVQTFVDNYNKLRAKLSELTAFNQDDPTKSGVLLGENSALQVETNLAGLLSGRFFGVGSINSLQSIGISFNDNGTLNLDQTEFKTRYAAAPQEVRNFFSNTEAGLAAKVDAAAERLAGRDNSVLVNRALSLGRKIDTNGDRIEFMNGRLEAERNRLLLQFYRMELTIGKLQSSLNALTAIAPLPSLLSQQSG